MKQSSTNRCLLRNRRKKITAVLAGDESADTEYERKQVIMNTALRYYLFGHCAAIEEGVRTAEKQLKEKAGLEASRGGKLHLQDRKKTVTK